MAGDGLICGYLLDGRGGGQEIGWDGVESWQEGQGTLWVHLDRSVERACDWVRSCRFLDEITAEALLAEETRPRCFPSGDGLLVILRGVNLNPGAEPEDMVGLRIFANAGLVITVRIRQLMAVSDLRELFGKGTGPKTSGELLAVVADRLVARMEPVVDELGAEADKIETDLSQPHPSEARKQLSGLRSTAIVLKRYLAPQRDLMARLSMDQHDWLAEIDRLRLREVADRTARYVEELEEVRERAVVLQDELLNQLSQESNRTVYILTIVASVMLPLSFVTGLLGINVAGIPGSEYDSAFWIVCALLIVFAAGQAWLFRRLKWI